MSAATNKLLERNDHTDLYLAGTTTVSEAPQSASEQEELLNREISLLQFYKRVLEEARDESQPVLERLKFLAILSDNLDEFFMVRVSGLKETHEEFVGETLPGGKTADMQLRESREFLLPLLAEQSRALSNEVLPRLKSCGIQVATYESLSDDERATVDECFHRRIYPVLTPQGVDPGHPFPYISGLNLNLGLMVRPIVEKGKTQSLAVVPEPRFARIEIPKVVPRLLAVDQARTKFVLVEDVISANIDSLFPRLRTGKCYAFRVTRDADVEVREEKACDLLRMMQQTLRRRRFGLPVRLEVSRNMPREMSDYLLAELKLDSDDLYELADPLDIGSLMSLYAIDRPDLKDRPFNSFVPPALKGEVSFFDAIKREDILLHHPYHTYSTVTDFVNKAAQDPDVLAIKMCLYRTGKHSPIPEALMKASESGKQVTVLVELKARFDEENNIEWAKRLEEAGVHVVYGVLGLKTHSKLTLIVRAECEEIRRYVHIATGNYNPVTSGFYTDLGLLTADEEIGEDASDLFNYLTGFSALNQYKKLLCAPVNMRAKILGLIGRETSNARAGRTARIIAKINRLADTEIIRALYEASQAGVQIDLIVRGLCMLRPGVPGLSENIKVRSIVGRFLEHSRIFFFANGGDEEVYIGSSDWMMRNFDRRVEVVTPIRLPKLKRYLKDEVLDTYLADNVKARQLMPDGSYVRVQPQTGEPAVNSQTHFYQGPTCGLI